ncbi:MAG: hypothetical protein HYT79_07155 [Elusimicrobia bacterium]|nr:hypothetical protein [Elusimicrobiota bacterium]
MNEFIGAVFKRLKENLTLGNAVAAILLFSAGFGVSSAVYFADQRMAQRWEMNWPDFFSSKDGLSLDVPAIPDLNITVPKPEEAALPAQSTFGLIAALEPAKNPPAPHAAHSIEPPSYRKNFPSTIKAKAISAQKNNLQKTPALTAANIWPKEYDRIFLCLILIGFLGIFMATRLTSADPSWRLINSLAISAIFGHSLFYLHQGLYQAKGPGLWIGFVLIMLSAMGTIYGCYNSYLEKEKQ